MDSEPTEYLDALKELKLAVHGMYEQAKETERALSGVVNDSHLRSLLTLAKEDIFVRQLFAKQWI